MENKDIEMNRSYKAMLYQHKLCLFVRERPSFFANRETDVWVSIPPLSLLYYLSLFHCLDNLYGFENICDLPKDFRIWTKISYPRGVHTERMAWPKVPDMCIFYSKNNEEHSQCNENLSMSRFPILLSIKLKQKKYKLQNQTCQFLHRNVRICHLERAHIWDWWAGYINSEHRGASYNVS